MSRLAEEEGGTRGNRLAVFFSKDVQFDWVVVSTLGEAVSRTLMIDACATSASVKCVLGPIVFCVSK